ncbi:MAG: TylF/MycF/NovP-related O-methyltransferase [Pseudonocardiaceae bacterium]
MNYIPPLASFQSSYSALEDVCPTIAVDHIYDELKRKFIASGDDSTINITQRREIVRRFEEVDRSIPLVTTPTDGLILAELMINTSAMGDIVECGCFAGGSSAKLSIVTQLLNKRLVIFDSFQGLLVVQEFDKIDYHTRHPAGWLKPWYTGKYSASMEIVKNNIAAYGEISVCDFVPGYFTSTLAAPNLPDHIALAFTDVDTPTAVHTCLTQIWPHLSSGGIYASHDVALIKSLQVLLSREVWSDEIGEFPPILFGAGFGVCDHAPHMGYFVKGDTITAEYLKSLTLNKRPID